MSISAFFRTAIALLDFRASRARKSARLAQIKADYEHWNVHQTGVMEAPRFTPPKPLD